MSLKSGVSSASIKLRGDINVCYLVRGGPSDFCFFSRKNVGRRKFVGPKGQKNFLGVNLRCMKDFACFLGKKCRICPSF